MPNVAYQAPLSMGFSRQEYWSGLPFPSPGDLHDPEIEPGLLPYRKTLYHLSHQGSSTDGRGGFKSRPAGPAGHTVLGCEEEHWPEIPQEAGVEDG